MKRSSIRSKFKLFRAPRLALSPEDWRRRDILPSRWIVLSRKAYSGVFAIVCSNEGLARMHYDRDRNLNVYRSSILIQETDSFYFVHAQHGKRIKFIEELAILDLISR